MATPFPRSRLRLLQRSATLFTLLLFSAALGVLPGNASVAWAAPPSPDLAEATRLIEQGSALNHAHNPAGAIPFFAKALELREKVLGPDAPDVVFTVVTLAGLDLLVGDTAHACPLFDRALSTIERNVGMNEELTAERLVEVAACRDRISDLGAADAAMKRALTIFEKTAPEGDEFIDALTQYATLQKRARDLEGARASLDRALATAEKAHGPDHPVVADVLVALATLELARVNRMRAFDLLLRAAQIRSARLGPDHVDTQKVFVIAAGIAVQIGNLAQANDWLIHALPILDRELGVEDPSILEARRELAHVFTRTGRLPEARTLLEFVLATGLRAFPSAHPVIEGIRVELATTHLRLGDFDRAQALVDEAAAASKAAGVRDVSGEVMLTMIIAFARGHVSEGIDALAATEDVIDAFYRRALTTGSNEDREQVFGNVGRDAKMVASIQASYAPNDARLRRLAMLTVLRHKGMLVDLAADGVGALRRRMSNEDRALLDRLGAARSALSSVALLRNPDPAAVTALEAQASAIEEQVSARNAAFHAAVTPVTIEAVQSRIPADSALVEIVRYAHYDARLFGDPSAWGTERYAAYLLRREGEPAWVDLGDADPIDARARALRAALAGPDVDARPSAKALYTSAFAPVAAILGDTRRVLLAPDGALSLVPFAALMDERGTWALERFDFVYLASGRDLLRLGASPANPHPPLIIAAPDFGTPPPATPNTADRRARFIKMSPLPGAAKEAAALAKLFPDATVLTGVSASKSAVLAAHSPRILHLATHGIFIDDAALAGGAPDARGLVLDADAPPKADVPPMLRAFLAFSGANTPAAADNGILTALEASTLDLLGTKLVVLSACQSGLGDVRAGDGVYGLRRAFATAGAESLLMTLWSVSDDATRDLMVDYYRDLSAGGGRAQALRRAQQKLLHGSKWAHPYYWAAFIPSGDWRSLDGKDAPETATSDANLPRVPPGACGCETVGEATMSPYALALICLVLSAASLRRPRRVPCARRD